jgi:hypothetical protein
MFVIHFLLLGVRKYTVYCSTNAKLREINAFVRNTVHIEENTCATTERERDYFRNLGVEGSITLECGLRNVQCMICGLDTCGSGKGSVTVSYVYGIELRSTHNESPSYT